LVEPTTQGREEVLAADDGEVENEDRLLAEAGKVVREYRRASVSLLQRRLSIGYSRAARLLDQLEERGIVGPSDDGCYRLVLDPENDRAERDQA
jgi:S-DNA-T family DNA segregation ATPase FtsK/SpoIIIE